MDLPGTERGETPRAPGYPDLEIPLRRTCLYGHATALRLAADGMLVVVNDMKPSEELDRIVEECGGIPAIADVSDPHAVEEMVSRIEAEAGPLGVLVSNAAYMAMGPFLEQSEDEWWAQIRTNLCGTFHLIRSVLPGMRRLGRGKIVIVSSEWGVTGWPNATAYAASKAGLISLGKTLGRELAPEGIFVNVVAPGVTDTPQLECDARDAGIPVEEMRERYAAESPIRRIGKPEEIAATISFLASSRSDPFVGQVLQPNGGTTRCWA